MSEERERFLVYTKTAYEVDTCALPHSSLPEDKLRVEFFANGTRVSEHAVPVQEWNTLSRTSLFRIPRKLGLIGEHAEDGIKAMVVLLIPDEEYEEIIGEEKDEPWAISSNVPTSEFGEDDQTEEAYRSHFFVIGTVHRSISDRVCTDDMDSELVDMLRRLIAQPAPSSPEQYAIDALLESIR